MDGEAAEISMLILWATSYLHIYAVRTVQTQGAEMALNCNGLEK